MTNTTSTAATSTSVRNHVYLTGISLVALGLMSLGFFGLSWFFGGSAYMNSIYGKETMMLLLVAVGIGASLMLSFRDETRAAARPLSLNERNIAGERG